MLFLYWLLTLRIISSRFNRVIHMIGFPSFSRLQNVCTTFSLSIWMSKDIWVVSISWLSWITLQWTLMCKYLFKVVLWNIYFKVVFWDINLEMGLLVFMVVIFWAFRGTCIILSTVAASFFIPTKSAQTSNVFKSSSALVIFCSFDGSHANGLEVISYDRSD